MSTSFSGGYACMPEVKKWANSIRKGSYLNSGVYIGKTDFLQKVIEEACKYVTPTDLTASEYRDLGCGISDIRLCERLPEFPKGCQDQDILRYIHPKFYPRMQVDYDNELAFRN